MHRRMVPYPNYEVAKHLASGIPDARLLTLEGDSLCMYLGDTQAVTRAVMNSSPKEEGARDDLLA